jgi:Fe-S cluster assembly protein SufD
MREADHVDHHTAVDHRVGQTRTNQLFKGILSDSARLVFNGKIFIRKQAQKSEAYQTCKNLLLSENAEANAKPQLEIDADDVKASHGAAIGTVNPQELFYLQSRCIEKSKAMAILCRGFADDVMFRLKDNQIREALAARVGRWFEGQADHGKQAEGQ